MSDSRYINSDLYKVLDVFSRVEQTYKSRNFKDALEILERGLDAVSAPTPSLLSDYYDIAASILWKVGEFNKSYQLWRKAVSLDQSNRHSYLCLHMLFDQEISISDYCELFLRIKLNEYFCIKEGVHSRCECSQKEEEIIGKLLQYWNEHISGKDFDSMDELEIVEYFINTKVAF